MNKPKYIVFTGGCYSGKTTSMEIIKNILESQGKHVIMFDELIRRHNIISIDDARKDPNKYMDLQYDIINGKIDMELSVLNKYDSNTFILVDRAVTDSLFYLTFYVNKNGLDKEHQQKFFELFSLLNDYLSNVTNIYDYVLEFKPIENKVQEDSFRPSNLNDMQRVEYEMIKKYNQLYFTKMEQNYRHIDLNEVNINDMQEYWKKYLKTMV